MPSAHFVNYVFIFWGNLLTSTSQYCTRLHLRQVDLYLFRASGHIFFTNVVSRSLSTGDVASRRRYRVTINRFDFMASKNWCAVGQSCNTYYVACHREIQASVLYARPVHAEVL